MPVTVQCFHCNAVLELDDGFRGGICRCGTCGSLLQVPRGDPADKPTRGKRPAGPPAPAKSTPAPQPSAAIVQPHVPSGRLDPTNYPDPGVSSGLSGRIHKTKPIAQAPRKPPAPTNTPPRRTSSPTNDTKAPSQPSARHNHPLWLTILFLVATAALVGLVIYLFVFKL